jgi:hypothetical protein
MVIWIFVELSRGYSKDLWKIVPDGAQLAQLEAIKP